MGRRTLLLLAALVVAALGTTGIYLYVNGVDDRAEADYKIVKVLVATSTIPVGTSGQSIQDGVAVELRSYLGKSVANLPALSDLASVLDQVTIAPIPAGSPVLSTQFGAPGDSTSLPILPGDLAISLEMDNVGRVAGFVGAGSKVVLFITTTPETGQNSGQEVTRVLLPEVDVIAAGQTTQTPAQDGTETEQLPRTLLTVSVDQADAQKILYASGHGKLTFGLLNDKSEITKADPGANAGNLFE